MRIRGIPAAFAFDVFAGARAGPADWGRVVIGFAIVGVSIRKRRSSRIGVAPVAEITVLHAAMRAFPPVDNR